MSCCVPLCPFKGLKPSTFGVPKVTSLKHKWEQVLDTTLKKSSRVCRYHFKNEDIKDTWVSGQGFSKYTVII